jgi:L-threonylcarbamoyladenylate synthase
MTRLITIDPHAPAPEAIAEAAALLRAGLLVAFPTETVYGLGANALDPVAVARIFEAKGRPATNPLIVHVADPEMVATVASAWPETARLLAEAFWPGPLTLVLPKRPEVPDAVTAGLSSVGVRMPAHPVAQALIRAAGVPVAAPSANPYMGVSPTLAAQVLKGMEGRIEAIVDGGPAMVGLESTVLDLTGEVPMVLRPGGLPISELRRVLGKVEMYQGVPGAETALPSPGLARRHYAPKARVRVLGRQAISLEASGLLAAGEKVGVLGFGAVAELPEGVVYQEMAKEPAAFGSGLYAQLHAFDERGVGHLLIEAPPEGEDWVAVRDRLRRAAEA